MGQIYAAATNVCCYLGPGDESAASTITLIQRIAADRHRFGINKV